MHKEKINISIIIPSYNEEKNISVLYSALTEILSNTGKSYEIIFVNDGSTDNTLSEIKNIAGKSGEVRYISFSKNFGHQIALKAGIDMARGDCVITMDADMQHPPELIKEMLYWWNQGYDIVYTYRKDEGNTPYFKRATSQIFYQIFRMLSDIPIEEGAADFRLMDKKVADVIRKINDPYLFLRGLIPWLGFKQKKIEYIPKKRLSGVSKYTFRRMWRFAVNGITGFSIKPLRVAIFIGLIFSFFSFIYMIYAIYVYFFDNRVVSGWASMVTMVSMIGGIQLIILGIMGEYIGKMYFHIKNRPVYIIDETNIITYEKQN